MATVSTQTVYCFHKEFKRVVRYKSRDSLFYITLPNRIPEKEVSSETEDGAIKKFNSAVEVYEKSVTNVKKVILYGYEVDAYIREPNGDDGIGQLIFNSQDDCKFGKTFTEDGITLSLWVVVCEKSEVVLEGMKNYISYEEIESSIPDSLEPHNHNYGWNNDFQELPFTPENEQFFIDIGSAMEQLILKLNSILGDKDKTLSFISSGQKFLPSPNSGDKYV